MGPDAMILVFWILSFKSAFSLSSSTFIKRLFSSSSLSAIRVESFTYLRWLIFLSAVLIPTCGSSSPTISHDVLYIEVNYAGWQYTALSHSFLSFEPVCSIVPCKVLTVASWSMYRIFRRQVRWSGIPICLRFFHSLLWSTQSKAFL